MLGCILELVGDLLIGLQMSLFRLYFVTKIIITQRGNCNFCALSKQKMNYFRLKEQTPNKLTQRTNSQQAPKNCFAEGVLIKK